MGLSRLESSCLQGCGPSRGSRGESTSWPFPASRGTHIPWLMTPSSIFKASRRAASHSLLLTLLPPSYKDPCDHTGPTLIHQNNLPISKFVILITSAKSLLPCMLVLGGLPQTGWLKTIDISSLTVLEARRLKSRCQQDTILPKALEEDPSLPLPVSGSHRCSWACSCSTSISSVSMPPLSRGILLYVPVSRFPPFCKDASHIGLRGHLAPI